MESILDFFTHTLDGTTYIVVVVICVIFIFALIGFLAERKVKQKKIEDKMNQVGQSVNEEQTLSGKVRVSLDGKLDFSDSQSNVGSPSSTSMPMPSLQPVVPEVVTPNASMVYQTNQAVSGTTQVGNTPNVVPSNVTNAGGVVSNVAQSQVVPMGAGVLPNVVTPSMPAVGGVVPPMTTVVEQQGVVTPVVNALPSEGVTATSNQPIVESVPSPVASSVNSTINMNSTPVMDAVPSVSGVTLSSSQPVVESVQSPVTSDVNSIVNVNSAPSQSPTIAPIPPTGSLPNDVSTNQ